MSADELLVEMRDGVGWLTFNRPERHNALTEPMCVAAIAALEAFQADPQVRLCAMRGAGGKAFVSGADIGGLPSAGRRREGERPPMGRFFDVLAAFEKPLLAVIRGWCLGGGVAVAMKADIRLCAADARFGIPAARLGVGYPTDAVRDLVALVGPSAAKTILFTAERISAAEALRIGLVDEVLEPDALDSRVAAVAAAIGENAPLSIRAAKMAIDHVSRGAHSAEAVEALVARCFASADFTEGRAAFLEKRRPAFRGA